MIQLMIVGNLGADAKVTHTSGKSVINFRVADTQKWVDQDAVIHERTTWVNCSIWRNADTVQNLAVHLTKGTRVFVQGIPSLESWRSKVDGSYQCGMAMKVDKIEFMGGGKKEEAKSADSDPAEIPGEDPEWLSN